MDREHSCRLRGICPATHPLPPSCRGTTSTTTTVTLVYQSYWKTTGWLGPPGDWHGPQGKEGRT